MLFSTHILALSTLVSVAFALPKGSAWRMRRQAADLQTSLSLDPSLVQPGLAQDGQATPEPNQVPSLTSKNNFINFCATQNVPLTNGLQIKGGSCNPTPMGRIIAKSLIPASKFVFPVNGDTSLVEFQNFTIKMAIQNLVTGNFVNAAANYYMAPQVTNDQGVLIGHSHVVVQQIESLDSTKPLDPNTFAFFKGLNVAADGQGLLTTSVDKGLPAGTYRLASINAGMNHQPALVAVAQHGSIDDGVYFTVNPAGGAAAPPA